MAVDTSSTDCMSLLFNLLGDRVITWTRLPVLFSRIKEIAGGEWLQEFDRMDTTVVTRTRVQTVIYRRRITRDLLNAYDVVVGCARDACVCKAKFRITLRAKKRVLSNYLKFAIKTKRGNGGTLQVLTHHVFKTGN